MDDAPLPFPLTVPFSYGYMVRRVHDIRQESAARSHSSKIIMDDLTKKYRTLFVAAACFNWTAGILFLKPSLLFDALGITPVPSQDMILHLTSLSVFFYGIAYYMASKDFVKNENFGVRWHDGKGFMRCRCSSGRCAWIH